MTLAVPKPHTSASGHALWETLCCARLRAPSTPPPGHPCQRLPSVPTFQPHCSGAMLAPSFAPRNLALGWPR